MAQSLTQAEILSFLGPGYLDPDSFSYSEDLEEVQEIFQGKTKEEALELLEDLERTESSEETYQGALITQSAEQPSEEERLAVVDSKLRPEGFNPLLDTPISTEQEVSVEKKEEEEEEVFNPILATPISTRQEISTEADVFNPILDASLSKEEIDGDFSHISTDRRVQFGAAREPMVAGILWDMGKATGRALLDGDKTYAQAMDEVSVENLEKVYQEFPEFRGVSFYEEDGYMTAGRLGVAFIDPVAWMLPWGKAARMGYLGTAGLSGAYAATFQAGFGHVERDEYLTSPSSLALTAAFGGVLGGFGHGLQKFWTTRKSNKIITEVENANLNRTVNESVGESDEIARTINTLDNETPTPIKVVDSDPVQNDMRPIREILRDRREGLGSINRLPANATNAELANAHREFLLSGRRYEVEKDTIDFVKQTTEDLINAPNSKFMPDPKIATDLSEDLRIIIGWTEQIKKIPSQIKDVSSQINKIGKGKTEKEKAKLKELKQTKKDLKKTKNELKEKLASASLRNFKNTINRMMDGHDLFEATFDAAIKQEKLNPSMVEHLIRSSTDQIFGHLARPAFGAIGGFTASQFFADTEDGYGSTVAWTVGGAALMKWQGKIQAASISQLNKETGEMTINDQWRKWMSHTNLKFLTASSVSTKLDSLGGIGKVVGNLLFNRPGGGTHSIESKAFEEMTAWNLDLAKILGRSRNDDDVLTTVGEVLNKFAADGNAYNIKAGYRGLGNRLATPLTQEQINEVRRIVPMLERQRDELASSIERLNIPFERLDDYGMAQLYNFREVNKDPEKFKKILFDNLPAREYRLSGDVGNKETQIDNFFEKMFMRRAGYAETRKHYALDSIVSPNYKVRPLMNHFEQERFIKDPATRKALAEAGFINLNSRDVFQTYAKKTIDIREFAKVFGPNSEFITEAFKLVNSSFKKAGISTRSPEYTTYKDYMRDSINAYFGKYGIYSTPGASSKLISLPSQSMVALANMTYLTRVAIPSLGDFVAPFKGTSLKAATKAIGSRLSLSESSPSRRVGLKYNDDLEAEMQAFMVRSDDPLSSYTDIINREQRRFFKIVQLKRITEQAGRFAFDAGAFRAFDISKGFARNKKMTFALQRELREMGLQTSDLSHISKFKNANEAFDDDLGKEILTRAGMKVMDRDRLIPKVGNRLLFTQHRDPIIRQLGQFASWMQAKTSQTNALIGRIEEGDAKLFVRILGANIIANGAIQFFKDVAKPSFDPDEDFEPVNFLHHALDMGSDFNNWFISRVGGAWKYKLKQGESLAQAASPSWSWGAGFTEAVGSAYENLVEDQDYEGAIEDILSVLPYANELNRQLKRFGLPHFKDERKNVKAPVNPFLYAKGGEVLNVPNVPTEPDERIDKMTGLPYDQQAGPAFVDEEDPLRRLGFLGGGSVDPLVRLGFSGGSSVLDGEDRLGFVLGSVAARTIKRIVPSRSITEVIPDRVAAERAVDLDLTTEAFHGTLSNIKAFKIESTDFGIHVGTPEQAWSRIKYRIEEERMGDEIFQSNKEAEHIEDLLRDKKLDPKMRKELNAEANRLQESPSLEDYIGGANIIPVFVKAQNPLRIAHDIEWRQIDKVVDGLLESDLIKKLQISSGEKITDQEIVKKLKNFRRRARRLEKPYYREDPADSSSKIFDVDSYYKDKKAISLVGEIKKFIQDQGYDSLIYKNMYEYAGQRRKKKDSLIIFDTNNIRSRHAEFDLKEAKSSDLLKATGGEISSLEEPEKALINWERIREDEGYIPELYVMAGGGSPDEQSGVTMLEGIDLGQGNKNKVYSILKNLGISAEESSSFKKAVDKISGLKGRAARNAFSNLDSELRDKASLFLETHGSSIQNMYNKNEEPKIENTYNAIAGTKGIQFKELPQEWRTVVASAHRQYGNRKLNLYQEIARGDFSGAVANLNDWKDTTPDYADSINDRYARYGAELMRPREEFAEGSLIGSIFGGGKDTVSRNRFEEGGEALDNTLLATISDPAVRARYAEMMGGDTSIVKALQQGTTPVTTDSTTTLATTPATTPATTYDFTAAGTQSIQDMISSGAFNLSSTASATTPATAPTPVTPVTPVTTSPTTTPAMFGGLGADFRNKTGMFSPENQAKMKAAAAAKTKADADRQAAEIAAGKAARDAELERLSLLEVPTAAEFWGDTEETLNWDNPFPKRPGTVSGVYESFDYTVTGSGIAGGGNFALAFDRAFSSQWKSPIAGLSDLQQNLYSGNSFLSAEKMAEIGNVPQNVLDIAKLNQELKRQQATLRNWLTNKEYILAFQKLGIDPKSITTPEALAAIPGDFKAAVFDLVQRQLQQKNQREKPFGFGDAMGIAAAALAVISGGVGLYGAATAGGGAAGGAAYGGAAWSSGAALGTAGSTAYGGAGVTGTLLTTSGTSLGVIGGVGSTIVAALNTIPGLIYKVGSGTYNLYDQYR